MSEWDEADDAAWLSEQRDRVIAYLQEQPGEQGPVREPAAWYVSPHVAIWAIESLAAPGRVGWWVISGDLPTDYCSFRDGSSPRAAAAYFAKSWREAAGDPREDGTLGATGLPAKFRDLLASRASILAEWVEDDEIWLIAEAEWI